MVNLFLKETLALPSLPNGERPVSLLQASTARVRAALGASIQTKDLRERSHLKAVNNATVMSLYKIEKSLQSGRGVLGHVTAPWSPT